MTTRRAADDLAALRLFATVAEVGSVSKAAAVHGITQPSASNRLSTLERRLGVRLLHRTTAGSLPTSAGTLVAEWSRKLLRAADEWETSVESLSTGNVDPLRIAASYTIAEYLLPAWLGRYRSTRRDGAVELEVMNSAAVMRRLDDGDVALGFVESAGDVRGCRERVVATDELIAVVAPGHPWARRASINLSTFVAAQLVVRELGSGTRDALENALRARGLGSPRIALTLGSTSAILSAVADGGCPAVLSELAVQADLDSGRLVRVQIRDLTIARKLRAVWPRRHAPPRAARQLLAQLPDL